MSGKLKPMAPVDAGWFHMDGFTNLAMVTGVVLTSEPLDFARAKAVFAHRLLSFERFHQRVVEAGMPLATPHWQDDPYFNVDDHFHHVALPAPGDQRVLMDLLSDLTSTPLDYNRPLWQVHVVDNVDGGGALVLRFHHCVGDGTAMMALSQRLFDATPDAPLDLEAGDVRPPPRAGLFDRVFDQALQAVIQSATLVNATVQGGVDMLRHPSHVLDLTQLAARSVGVAVGTLLKMPDPSSLLKGKQGMHKRVAWSQPVTLTDVRAIGAATGGKVNDVLVGAIAGALRHYMQERGADVDGMIIRGVVPVDLRPPDRALELGNHFGLTFLDLPIGVSGALERLHLTKRAMDAIKHSPEAAVFMGIIGIVGQSPKRIEDLAVSIFGSKATLVMTNVAGPRATLYVAGRAIRQMMFWVPHPGSLGMGISILSYNGMATVGVVADAGLVPDPEQITARFEQEFAHLLAMAHAKGSTAPIAIQATPEPAARAAAQPVIHCAAKTASGRPCRNFPITGSPYCRVHQR